MSSYLGSLLSGWYRSNNEEGASQSQDWTNEKIVKSRLDVRTLCTPLQSPEANFYYCLFSSSRGTDHDRKLTITLNPDTHAVSVIVIPTKPFQTIPKPAPVPLHQILLMQKDGRSKNLSDYHYLQIVRLFSAHVLKIEMPRNEKPIIELDTFSIEAVASEAISSSSLYLSVLETICNKGPPIKCRSEKVEKGSQQFDYINPAKKTTFSVKMDSVTHGVTISLGSDGLIVNPVPLRAIFVSSIEGRECLARYSFESIAIAFREKVKRVEVRKGGPLLII